jgi:hypothetical protein
MAHTNWCGKHRCGDCEADGDCLLDLSIPCSPDCKGLRGDMIDVVYCVKAGCLKENLMHMFYGGYDENESEQHMIQRLFMDYVCLDTGLTHYPYSGAVNYYDQKGLSDYANQRKI